MLSPLCLLYLNLYKTQALPSRYRSSQLKVLSEPSVSVLYQPNFIPSSNLFETQWSSANMIKCIVFPFLILSFKKPKPSYKLYIIMNPARMYCLVIHLNSVPVARWYHIRNNIFRAHIICNCYNASMLILSRSVRLSVNFWTVGSFIPSNDTLILLPDDIKFRMYHCRLRLCPLRNSPDATIFASSVCKCPCQTISTMYTHLWMMSIVDETLFFSSDYLVWPMLSLFNHRYPHRFLKRNALHPHFPSPNMFAERYQRFRIIVKRCPSVSLMMLSSVNLPHWLMSPV